MSSAYMPKDDQCYRRSVEVQKLTIPFFITANATPASKTVVSDEPSLLFLDVQGINNCTVASGAFDTSAEAAAITFQTPSDTAGQFSVLVRTNEPNALVKVMYCRVVSRSVQNEGGSGTPSSGSSPSFLTSVGNKIVADFTISGLNLATTNGDLCLEVEYIAAE